MYIENTATVNEITESRKTNVHATDAIRELIRKLKILFIHTFFCIPIFGKQTALYDSLLYHIGYSLLNFTL